MRTILIAHRDVDFASDLAAAISSAGYRTVICPGPWPPTLRCIRCDVGYCPLTEGTDLMIYDPGLRGGRYDGDGRNLAIDSAKAHPDVPLLLAWSGSDEPPEVREVVESVPTAQRGAPDPADLVEQVRDLVGPAW